MKRKLLGKDFIVGLICIGVSIFFGCASMFIRASLNSGDPGPKLFPLIGCAILFVCGVGMLLRKPADGGGQFLTKTQWKRAGLLFGLYILNFLLLWLFGFIIATVAMLFILCVVFTARDYARQNRKKIVLRSLVYALLLGAAVYLIYAIALDTQLPAGIVWGR